MNKKTYEALSKIYAKAGDFDELIDISRGINIVGDSLGMVSRGEKRILQDLRTDLFGLKLIADEIRKIVEEAMEGEENPYVIPPTEEEMAAARALYGDD